ncbi:GntR family transcriptional regulator [Streptomyces sp. NPDC049970]|uniref:GntR family transcriptional regulator n=1 Tax=Streptomyces sp. NPDC049970 TaxID=3155033 RepID=UPI003428F238
MPEQPPYLRVADVLRQRIVEHVWEPGDRLPSRAQIGEECGVGENVVRRAQELLISQGVLEGRAGSGTYVAEPRPRVRVVRSSAREQPTGSPYEEASLLGIQKSALVTHIKRTYYSDQGRPVETADIVLPAALCEIVYEVPIGRQ